MRILAFIHSAYSFFIFGFAFLLLLPFFLIIIFIRPLRHLTYVLNYLWAKLFFTLSFLPVVIKHEGEKRWSRKKKYIFCANHFSYLDIPLLGYTFTDFVFVGKSELSKVPLFGFMFKNLHVTVDRNSFRDRYNALGRSRDALHDGRSLIVFPEGGIVTPNPPQMSRFKEGAFRLAIEEQIPIVPVTIPYNWILLPDKGFLLDFRKTLLIYHEPIETSGMTLKDVDQLKIRTFDIIQNTINRYNHEH